MYSGSYVGTGTYGSNNEMSITFPFEPIIFILPYRFSSNKYVPVVILSSVFPTDYDWIKWLMISYSPTVNPCYAKKSNDGKTITWYADDSNGASSQANVSGQVYHYAAIGGYDMGKV